MFKKIISAMLALVVVIGGAVSVSAACASEDGRPGIIGLEHLEAIKKVDELHENNEIEIPYVVTMGHADRYWVVTLEGVDAVGYSAVGLYDHYPTEEELNILWANRLTDDEIDSLLEGIDF